MTVEIDGRVAVGRRRPWATAVGAALMVAVLGLAVAGGGAMLRQSRLAVPLEPAAPEARASPAIAKPRSSRVIEDSREAALPRGRDSGWVRAAPREPLGASQIVPLKAEDPPNASPAPTMDPGTPRPTLLFQPVATAAGRIEAAGHVVEMEGVEVLDPARQCTGGDGRPWPCGTVARAAFRAWLRGRAVECTVAPTPGGKPVVSACRLGKDDAAAWLVANGFAAALPGGAYEQAGAEAKAARRGIFGDRPKRVSVTVGAGGGILPDLRQQIATGEAAPAAPPTGQTPVGQAGDAAAPGQPAPAAPETVTPSP